MTIITAVLRHGGTLRIVVIFTPDRGLFRLALPRASRKRRFFPLVPNLRPFHTLEGQMEIVMIVIAGLSAIVAVLCLPSL